MKTLKIIFIAAAFVFLGLVLRQSFVRGEPRPLPVIDFPETKNDATLSELGRQEDTEKSVLCFGSRTHHRFDEQDPGGYGYNLLQFDISTPDDVEGAMRYYPYGTDSNVSSFTEGQYYPESGIVTAQVNAYGEGTSYVNPQIWKIGEGELISGYTSRQLAAGQEDFSDLDSVIWNEDYATPEVDCETLDVWEKEMYDIRGNYTNDASDTDRLTAILGVESISSDTTVTERYIDADMNWETEETMFYLEGPEYCSSEGCTLIFVNKDNTIINTYTGTSTPVYMSVYDTESQRGWRDIIVWNDGSYRLLQHDGKSYPKNSALAPFIAEREVEWRPNKYYLVTH